MRKEIFTDIDAKLEFISDQELEEFDIKKLKLVGIWLIVINLFYLRFQVMLLVNKDTQTIGIELQYIYWINTFIQLIGSLYFYIRHNNIIVMKSLFIMMQLRVFSSIVHFGDVFNDP